MKSMLRHVSYQGGNYDALAFVCPGCLALGGGSGLHLLPVNAAGNPSTKSPAWNWDGNLEAPTLSPSILTSKDDEERRCHSFLKAGVFEFLGDCAHPLAGQSVPMADLPDWFTRENEEESNDA